jgi:hypothetical protein
MARGREAAEGVTVWHGVSGEGSAAAELPIPRRTFSQLHRDVWSLIFRYKREFLVLPVALSFATEWLFGILRRLEGFTTPRGVESLERVTALLLAAFLWSLQLNTVRLRAAEEAPWGTIFRAAVDDSGRVLGTLWALTWRVLLGFLLFVIPGIVMALRYFVAIPSAVFERISGSEACTASREALRGQTLRLFFILLGWAVLYVPLVAGIVLIVPSGASPLLSAVLLSPLGLAVSVEGALRLLLYVDATGRTGLPRPVGPVDASQPWMAAYSRLAARMGVAAALVVSVVAFAGALGAKAYIVMDLTEKGDAAWLEGSYEESLRLFERAAYWDEEDAYVQYSIALCHEALGDSLKAESHAARAVALEPEDPDYRLCWIRCLLRLRRFEAAEAATEELFRRGFEYAGGKERLLEDLRKEVMGPEAEEI